MRERKMTGAHKNVKVVLEFFSSFSQHIKSDTPQFLVRQVKEIIEFIKFSGEDFTTFNSMGYREIFVYLTNVERFLAYQFQSMREFSSGSKSTKILSDLDRHNRRFYSDVVSIHSGVGNSDMGRDIGEQYRDSDKLMKRNAILDERWLQENTPFAETGYDYSVKRRLIPPLNGPIDEYKRTRNQREILNEMDPGLAEEDLYKDMRFARPGLMSTERNNPTLVAYKRRFANYV
jgi:hypothetical protein